MATFSALSTFAAAAITLQLLLVPASASPHMKYIDAICDRSHDQDYCVKTLTTNPLRLLPLAWYSSLNHCLFVCVFFYFTYIKANTIFTSPHG